jgi:Asp-tRNA(Asn)/Glu-tRNA(Gln) amidotransferase A subunit family amidase
MTVAEASQARWLAGRPLGPAFAKGRDVPDGCPSPDWTSWAPYTYPFNLSQQPAASVPCGRTSAGWPIGLPIVGPRHADTLVLRAARAYEKAAARPQPPTPGPPSIE